MGRKQKYNFHYDTKTKTGRAAWMRDWLKTRKEQEPEWYRNRMASRTEKRRVKKVSAVAQFGGICFDCKREYPPKVFEFHHLDSTTKDRDPAQMFMLSDKVIQIELTKCIMLCANCHRLRD